MLQCLEQEGNQCYRKKTNFKRSQHHVVPRDVRHKHDGVRKMRRLENLNELTNHGEKEEDESCDVDYIDLIDGRCESAFTKLYLEPENMTAWNSFVNSSEEEQKSILNQMASKSYRNCMDLAAQFGEEVLPAIGLNASDCFLRISHNLRQILRKNQFPKGDLERQEEELVSFFCTSPTSVYVAQISDSFHRLILHAVSQYLDLRSQSFNSPPGVRKTLVENRAADGFMPPSTSLAKFLNNGKISAVSASKC